MNEHPIENPEIEELCKYISDDDNVIKGIFKNHKIRFTQPSAVNDPLEFNPTIKFHTINTQYYYYSLNNIPLPSGYDLFRIKYIVTQINRYGILSLTRTPDSFSMWNLYSNGHKGAVLALKPEFYKHSCMLSPSGETYKLEKVIYEDEYSFKLDDVTPDDDGNIPLEQIYSIIFSKKSSRWKDEREWRMVRSVEDRVNFDIRDSKQKYLFDFSLDCIRSIIFGALMSVENKIKIKGYCKNHEISFYQSVIIRNLNDKYGKPGKVIPYSEEELKTLSPDFQIELMDPDACIMDKEQWEHRQSLQINNISEHLYFEIGKDFLLDYYNRSKQRDKDNPQLRVTFSPKTATP